MVRIHRFALACLVTSSLTFSGCANTRSQFASLWRKGANDSFSESIVDNRELPKSAREMADSVQSSLSASEKSAKDAKELVASTPKRYTESAKKLNTLDNRIDNVIARAKKTTTQATKKSRSDFPEDPFLAEFDALADASTAAPTKAVRKTKESAIDRLEAAKRKMASARDSFGGETSDVAERLISKAETLDKSVNEKATSVFEETVGDVNPFEALDESPATQLASLKVATAKAASSDEWDSTINSTVESAVTDFDDAKNKVVAVVDDAKKSTTTTFGFDDLMDTPDAVDAVDAVKKTAEKVADAIPKITAKETVASVTPTQPAEDFRADPSSVDADEFDLLFAEAGPAKSQSKRSFQETKFQPASAQRTAKPVRKPKQPAPINNVDPTFGTDFDKMIVDSDRLPQRTLPTAKATKPRSKSNTTDQFVGVKNQMSTYDDFFETDNSVRANQPGEATDRDSNPFSFIDSSREPKSPVTPVAPQQQQQQLHTPEAVPVEQPAAISPFEEFEQFDDSDQFGDDLPVADNSEPPAAAHPAKPAKPMRLVSVSSTRPTSVIRVSGNTAAANASSDLSARNQFAQPPHFELTNNDSALDLKPAELPTIVPGQPNPEMFNDEPFVDLSAVTQTPLENVAWEVEADVAAGTTGSRTSPWIAWIAVALCSIALILLLRPATNRIS